MSGATRKRRAAQKIMSSRERTLPKHLNPSSSLEITAVLKHSRTASDAPWHPSPCRCPVLAAGGCASQQWLWHSRSSAGERTSRCETEKSGQRESSRGRNQVIFVVISSEGSNDLGVPKRHNETLEIPSITPLTPLHSNPPHPLLPCLDMSSSLPHSFSGAPPPRL